jgi:thioredoxin 1
MALEITDKSIDGVLNENELVIIDFWAEWCGPCRILGPTIESLSHENEGIAVGKLDIMNNNESVQKYMVSSIPTVIFFKNGEEVHRTRGAIPKSALQAKIDELKN